MGRPGLRRPGPWLVQHGLRAPPPASPSRARGARLACGCIIRVVNHASRSPRADRPARIAAAILLAAATAACGSSAPTLSPGGSLSPTLPPSASVPASSSPTATPNISIVPVPTSRLAAPSSFAANLDPAKATALQAALNGIRSGGKYPGVSAAIVFPDGSTWTGVSGAAILSPATPLTTDTLFSVGSISKTFVAALVCRLAMAGTIGLDDPLSSYVPTFPNAASITIQELLDHTSGIRDIVDPTYSAAFSAAILAHPGATWTAAQVLAQVGPRYFAPGTGYHYSNTDFILLGEVVEKATGQTVAALVRSMFLTPLGLDHTYLQTEEQAQGPEAHGYMGTASTKPRDNSAGSMLPFTAEATAFGFAGAYVSTASDLALWANALYSGDVLDLATLASMVDISPSMAFKVKPSYPYGFGFEETTMAGQLAWGHRGHLDGFWSAMEYLPAYHVTVVVLTNAEWANPIAASSTLARIAIT
ncbi:MAG: serine hydrolase domain-containing protein [Candidatus Limnocylindrales bacterium]